MYLTRCGQTEASKTDAVTYSRITDMAAIYKILAAIRMHRPSPSAHYSSVDEILKTHIPGNWRLWLRLTEANAIVDDSRHFGFGTALNNLENFRMPMGKKTQDWLDRADRVVSIHCQWPSGDPFVCRRDKLMTAISIARSAFQSVVYSKSKLQKSVPIS